MTAVLSTGIMTGEERVCPVECNRTAGPYKGIVVELIEAITQEQLKPGPVSGAVA